MAKEEKPKKLTKAEVREEIRKLRTWIMPKEVKIREIEMDLEEQEMYMRFLKENIESGFLLNRFDAEIMQVQADSSPGLVRQIELRKKRTIRDIEEGWLIEDVQISIDDMKARLKIEKESKELIEKRIKMMQRNHQVNAQKVKEE